MAPEAETEEEPSIEEILDSIRQIISDEDAEEAAAEEEVVLDAPEEEGIPDIPADEPEEEDSIPEIPVDEEPEEEILDLTDKVEDEPEDDEDFDALLEQPEEDIEVAMQDPAEEEVAVEDVAADESNDEDNAVDETVEAPAEDIGAGIDDLDVASGDGDENLLTDKAEGAASDAIAALAARAAVVRAGNVTIEDIVREEMRPILRAWLDKNLPDIIERLMKKELERITKEVQD